MKKRVFLLFLPIFLGVFLIVNYWYSYPVFYGLTYADMGMPILRALSVLTFELLFLLILTVLVLILYQKGAIPEREE